MFGYRHGTPLEPRNLTRVGTELCAANGIRKVQLHGLRHTCVRLLLELGAHPRTGHGTCMRGTRMQQFVDQFVDWPERSVHCGAH